MHRHPRGSTPSAAFVLGSHEPTRGNFARCECGGWMRFATDDLGRSFELCMTCGEAHALRRTVDSLPVSEQLPPERPRRKSRNGTKPRKKNDRPHDALPRIGDHF